MIKLIERILEYEKNFVSSLFGKIFFREILTNSGRFIRMMALPTLFVNFLFCIVITFHGWEAVSLFGAQKFLPAASILVMIREGIPVLNAMATIAIPANAISAEIALMKLRGEFIYLETIGISPFRFAIFPKVIAITFVSILFFFISTLVSILAVFIDIVKIKGVAEGIFNENVWGLINLQDLFGGFIKSLIFGLIIGQISTYLGYYAKESAEGVGRASSLSVIISSIVFIITNVILSMILFGGLTVELR